MKNYNFANIAARPYPTMLDLNNKWILKPGTAVVLNVSQNIKQDIVDEIRKRGINYYHFPLKENVPDIGMENILKAVSVLLKYDATGHPIFVHCDCGNHRSRLVVEAFYYAKYRTHYLDEYKGFKNHLIYNCLCGFLPKIEQVEIRLLEQLSMD